MSNDYFDGADYTAPTRSTAARAKAIADLAAALTSAFNIFPGKDALNQGRVTYATAVGGTANAVTLTLSTPVTSYVAGLSILFKPSADNTGPVTLNVDGVGVAALKLPGGADMTGGEVRTDAVVAVAYNGTNFVLVSGFTSAEQAAVAAIAPNIATVAGVSADVTAVAGAAGPIAAVAGILSAVSTVAANLAAIQNASNLVDSAFNEIAAQPAATTLEAADLLLIHDNSSGGTRKITVGNAQAALTSTDEISYMRSFL